LIARRGNAHQRSTFGVGLRTRRKPIPGGSGRGVPAADGFASPPRTPTTGAGCAGAVWRTRQWSSVRGRSRSHA